MTLANAIVLHAHGAVDAPGVLEAATVDVPPPTTVTLRVIQQVYTDPPDRARRGWTAAIRPDREGRWNA